MAGRREKDLAADAPYREFANRLRDLRRNTGLTLDDIARISGKSKSTLSAACNGQTMPGWEVTAAFVEACGAKAADWNKPWRNAKVRGVDEDDLAHGPVLLSHHDRPPCPVHAQTVQEFLDTMRHLRVWAGNDSFRVIEKKSAAIDKQMKADRVPGTFYIARNTLNAVLLGDRMPKRELLEAFLTYAEVNDGRDRRAWIEAWQRLTFMEDKAKKSQRTAKPHMRLAT